jgi:hypothetical protein
MLTFHSCCLHHLGGSKHLWNISKLLHDWTETRGCPGQANNLAPLAWLHHTSDSFQSCFCTPYMPAPQVPGQPLNPARPDYIAQQQPSSHSMPWEPEISLKILMIL